MKKNEKYSPRALDESFGPVLVAAVHPIEYIVNRTYETLVSIKKTRRKIK
jgi:hypothetical protein